MGQDGEGAAAGAPSQPRKRSAIERPEIACKVLAFVSVKDVRRITMVSTLSREQALARLKQLPDPSWYLGLGRPQQGEYFTAEMQTGDVWSRKYEESIVVWDADGGALLFRRTGAAATPYCACCCEPIAGMRHSANCCSSTLCDNCWHHNFHSTRNAENCGGINGFGGLGWCSCYEKPHERDLCVVCGGTVPKYPFRSAENIAAIRRQADKGNRAAMRRLGSLYYHGSGVARDWATAGSWFARAADLGSADAQHLAGSVFSQPFARPRDGYRGAKYYAMAAAQHYHGMVDLAEHYHYRRGHLPDHDADKAYREAVRLYKLAIELENTDGRENAFIGLGRCYIEGLGVDVDRGEAERLFRIAAVEYHAPGELERHGFEVPPEAYDY